MRIVAIEATVPYWLEGRVPRFRPLERDERVDVAVVGGGVTGLACARLLAAAGLRTRVLEARCVASGASGRNGGFALRGFAVPYAERRDPALMRVSEEAVDRVEELAGDAFRRVGSLYIAASEDELALTRAEYEALARDGFAVELVDEADLPAPLRRGYRGGVFHPGDGVFDPGRWGPRLADAAAAAGAAIAEQTPAVSIDGDTVVTPRARVSTEQVVVATDGDTSGLLPELADVIAPARNQVLATAPVGERLFEQAVYARSGYDYWQQTVEGRIVLGGRRDVDLAGEATAVEGLTQPVQRALENLLRAIVPETPAVTHRWSGALAFTPDRLPLVGALPGRDRVSIALGYSGHGNALAVVCGEAVAQAILGRPYARFAAFSPERFPVARPPARRRRHRCFDR